MSKFENNQKIQSGLGSGPGNDDLGTRWRRIKLKRSHAFFVLFCIASGAASMLFNKRSTSSHVIDKVLLSQTVGMSLVHGDFPTTVSLGTPETQDLKVTYTLDDDLQEYATGLLKKYHPDFGAVVAFDAATGRLLAISDFSSSPEKHAELGNLATRAIYPAASVFKIVTAAAAIDEQKMSPETVIPYNGQNHTLYRKNILDTVFNRFTRYSTLRQAFAKSINAVFGKLGLHYIGPQSLIHYAHLFHFNHPIQADFPFESGQTIFSADKDWDVVQAASGFTLNSTLSPVHGALMASCIANNGVMMEPYMIDRLEDKTGHIVYEGTPKQLGTETLKPDSATQLRSLMQETVLNGTSRKSFRTVFGRKSSEIELGGKTGSLDGKNPKGRVDWFVGYGIWKNHRVGIAAVTVNEKMWRVKSSYLAGSMLQHYFYPRIQNERKVAHTTAGERQPSYQ